MNKQNVRELIVAKVDIVEVIATYVPLMRKGANFWGVCPFHPDKAPSMAVHREKKIFKCFACGKGGDVIDFVREFEKIPHGSALRKLAEKAQITLVEEVVSTPTYDKEQTRLIAAYADATVFFRFTLENVLPSHWVNAYLLKRGLTKEIVNDFSIGYASGGEELKTFLLKKGHDEASLINAGLIDHSGKDFFQARLMFPIRNASGDVVAFSGRIINEGDQPKYLNSPESSVFRKSEILYNWSHASESALEAQSLWICEGPLDVIALQKCGIFNAVATMGTALTPSHLKLINQLNLILCFDFDEAGLTAAERALNKLSKNILKTQVVVLENNSSKDVDELLAELGKEEAQALLHNAKISGLQFLYKRLSAKTGTDNHVEIERLLNTVSPALINAGNIERELIIGKIIADFKLSREAVLTHLSRFHELVKPINTTRQNANGKSTNKALPKPYGYIMLKPFISIKNGDVLPDTTIVLFEKFRKKVATNLFNSKLEIEIAEFLLDPVRIKVLSSEAKELAIRIRDDETIEVMKDEKDFNHCYEQINRSLIRKERDQIIARLEITSDENEKNSLVKQSFDLANKLRNGGDKNEDNDQDKTTDEKNFWFTEEDN